jgi:serine/threonine protein kinase
MAAADLQELLAQCLDRIAEAGRVAAAEPVLAAHPEHADALRERLGKLHRAGLLPLPAEAAPAPADHPERLGEFVLLRQLGRGGMGVVYLARQESLGREVALKLVHPDLLFFPGARERFRREVEAVARLQDPGIVPIHTVGEDAGIPYFAMEYVAGASLAEVVADLQGQDPASLGGAELLRLVQQRAGRDRGSSGRLFTGDWVEIACHIAQRMALAAHHAHERGVLHRDIKPSNVMLTPDGRVLLLDFGLAAAEGTSPLTRSGAVVGTLHYMAPEQVRGETLDVRTDVYALAATLYELLTLAPPHRADTGEGLRQAILRGVVASPTERNRAVPRDVATIVRKALDPQRERRYPSALAFAEDLERFSQHRPVLARPAGLALRGRRWVERHPAWATALLLAIVSGAGLGLVVMRGESAQRAADANLRNALQAIATLFERVRDPRLAATPGLDPMRLQQLEDATAQMQRLGDENPDNTVVQHAVAQGLLQAAELRSLLGQVQPMRAAVDRAFSILDGLHTASPSDPRLTLDLAHCLRTRSSARRMAADLTGAEADAAAALALIEPQLPADDPAALAIAGGCLTDLGQLAMAAKDGQKALAAMQRARTYDDRRLARDRSPAALLDAIRTRTGSTSALDLLGRPAEALAELEALRALHDAAVAASPTNPEVRREAARNHVAIARACRSLGRLDDARRECAAAAAGYDPLVRDFPHRTQYAWERSMIDFENAQAAEAAGDAAAAITAFREALARHTALIAANPTRMEFSSEAAVFAARLAALLQRSSPNEEFEALLRQAIAWQEPVWRTNVRDPQWFSVLLRLYNQLGRHCVDHDRFGDAIPLFTAMVAMAPHDPDPDAKAARERHGYSLQMLAVAYAGADQPERAVEALGRMVDLVQPSRAQVQPLAEDLHLADRADCQAVLARTK